jgi:hypothetical protein
MVTDSLFNKLKITSYPDGIKPVPNSRIEGTAFFPGGDGLYGHKEFAKSEIMILGQDFDNEYNFEKSKKRKSEDGNKTWSNLKKILGNEIDMERCFFTNAIMGLREGDAKNTGRSKAFLKKNGLFLDECRAFFIEQLKAQKPKLIIGLGAHIPVFLSETSTDLERLSKITSLSKIGESIEDNFFRDVVFKGIDDYKAVLSDKNRNRQQRALACWG